MSHKQQQKHARQDAEAAQQAQTQQPAPAAPAAAPAAGTDIIGQLEKLADLKANGLLTDAEYTAAKAQLLG